MKRLYAENVQAGAHESALVGRIGAWEQAGQMVALLWYRRVEQVHVDRETR